MTYFYHFLSLEIFLSPFNIQVGTCNSKRKILPPASHFHLLQVPLIGILDFLCEVIVESTCKHVFKFIDGVYVFDIN